MFLIPHHRKAGLFSQLNKLLTIMEHRQTADIHVDWSTGTLYGRPQDGNVFEHLFEQLAPLRPEDERVDRWPHWRYTGRHVSRQYPHTAWRTSLNAWWQYVSVRPDLLAEVESFIALHVSGITALHVRNYRIGAECTGGVASTLDDYAAAVEATEGKVFLATDNDEAARFFRSRFGDHVLLRDIPRSPDMQTELHHFRTQTIRDAQNCLIDALAMSRCSRLIHSVSNISTAVLYMNPACRTPSSSTTGQPHSPAPPPDRGVDASGKAWTSTPPSRPLITPPIKTTAGCSSRCSSSVW